ncbi:MAG: hypothetical protein KDN18_09705 [Verrucomicrobiae bacterium]|nr:hypothetical protein [Verrucomicrobiae bacterium]
MKKGAISRRRILTYVFSLIPISFSAIADEADKELKDLQFVKELTEQVTFQFTGKNDDGTYSFYRRGALVCFPERFSVRLLERSDRGFVINAIEGEKIICSVTGSEDPVKAAPGEFITPRWYYAHLVRPSRVNAYERFIKLGEVFSLPDSRIRYRLETIDEKSVTLVLEHERSSRWVIPKTDPPPRPVKK